MEEASPLFDAHALAYDQTLNAALSVTGEKREYFAEKRFQWMQRELARLGYQPKQALDYGCGNGASTPYFFEILCMDTLTATDVSAASLVIAQVHYQRRFHVRFCPPDHVERETCDLAYVNGVFHHIAPRQRASALHEIWRALQPGGLLAFWENNPLNPGTRYVMKRAPFDAEAMPLWPWEASRLISQNGFRPIARRYLFFFPKFLAFMRWSEGMSQRIPFGGQYVILSQKPLNSRHSAKN